MNQIESHRKKQHTEIRRANINQFLLRNRQLLTPLETKEARSEVHAQLQHLKSIVTHQQESQALYQCLLGLHKVVKDYTVINLISKRVDLPTSTRMRLMLGQKYQEITYLDLLVSLLGIRDQLPIMSELTFIIQSCVDQLSKNIKEKFEIETTNLYIDCVKKAVLNYPFYILDHPDLQIIEKTILFVYDSVVCCSDEGTTIYFLVNKLKPGILTYFNKLLDNPLLLNMPYMKQQIVMTILTVFFFMKKYNLMQHQLDDITQLVVRLKDIITVEIFEQTGSKDFCTYCQYMTILCQNKQLQLTKEEFQRLQSLIPQYIYQQHQPFFSLLEKVLYTHSHTLSSESYQNILRNIFYQIADYQDYPPEKSKFKMQLFNIIQSHITNCGNRFRLQEAEIFVFCWGEYSKADRLIDLVQFLSSLEEKGRKTLKILFQLIVMILLMREQLQAAGVALSPLASQLQILVSFEQFKQVLSQCDCQLQFQQC